MAALRGLQLTYFIETYGCQMNFAESAAVEQLLISRGWKKATAIQDCRLLIVNTCSVRITAETRVFGRLGLFSALKKKRQFSLLLMGCMAERLHDTIKKDFPKIDYVVGMFERNQFMEIFAEVEAQYSNAAVADMQERVAHILPSAALYTVQPAGGEQLLQYTFADCSYTEGAFQSFVPIMNGCNNFCTYCIVPYVRGREISRTTADILHEIDFLGTKGVKEITLLGQNVNSYRGTDMQTGDSVDFPSLLRRVAAHCENSSIQWIRFLSSHPKDMSDELINTIAAEKRVCKSVHLPVQHGSDAILKRMNRYYTRSSYMRLVEKLRAAVKNIVITTDILIGFPGETEEDFQQTLQLMKDIAFDSAFMYHYNPREGTKAYSYPDRIPDSVRINRLQQVIDLQMEITDRKMKSRLGSTVEVLLESHSRNNPDELFGHTEQGEMVVLTEKYDSKYIGHFVNVILQSVKGKTFRAQPIS